jgi:hypothetical protein
MNKYMLDNINIRVGDKTIVDGIDQIFESNHGILYRKVVGYRYNVSEELHDVWGEYLELRKPPDGDSGQDTAIHISRFNISKVGLNYNVMKPEEIDRGLLVYVSKDLTHAPIIHTFEDLEYHDEIQKYTDKELFNNPLKIIDICDVIVPNFSRSIRYAMLEKNNDTFVFPFYFLVQAINASKMYAPRKLYRFDEF